MNEGKSVHNTIFHLAHRAGLEKERIKLSRIKQRNIKRQILSAIDTDKEAERLLKVIEGELS